MKVRRVATGQTADGTSVVVSDEQLEPITVSLLPGAEYHVVWGSDTPVALPASGHRPVARSWFPLPGGFRFIFVRFPAHTSSTATAAPSEAALAEYREKLPGLGDVMEPDEPGHARERHRRLCVHHLGRDLARARRWRRGESRRR